MKNAIVMTMCVAMVACLTPASGAVWDFNEGSGTTVTDSVDGLVGTLQNDTAWTADGGGRSGAAGDYALDFDGGTTNYDYVSVPDSNSLDFTSAIVMDVWVNPGTMGSGGGIYKSLVSKPLAYQLKLRYARNVVMINLDFGSGYVSRTETISTLAIGSWSHIEVTYDSSLASNNLKLYVNGTLDNQWDQTGTLRNSTSGLTIGSYHNTAEGYTGLIDDVSVTPEPATMTLLLLGLPLALRRRRK